MLESQTLIEAVAFIERPLADIGRIQDSKSGKL